MILMVCMIVALLAGFTVSAAAEAGIVTYTLKDGDTVLKACQKNGIDFYAKQKLIAAINNIVDYRSLPVGFTVKLPTDAYVASASTAAATSAAAVGSSAVAVPGAATTANIAVGDTVSYYLIKYQMKSGDTVADVCNSLGVNFGTYSSMIRDINGIGSWNNVRAGSTILIPSATTPPVGTSCYAVVAHTVASGETATSICASYGMSYGANESLLKAINNKSNLNSIMRGSSFLVPVSTTIKGTSTTVPSSSSSSSSSGSGKTSTDPKVNSNDTKYTISADKPSTIDCEFLLNGKSVTQAAAGETITIRYTNNDSSKKLGSLTVSDSKGNSVSVSKNTFVMPASNATVKFSLITKNIFDIKTKITGKGTISVTVDGKAVTSTNGGKTVKVTATPADGYELQGIFYSTIDDITTGNALAEDGIFAMPNSAVWVRADFTEKTKHSITLSEDSSTSSTGLTTYRFDVGTDKDVTKAWSGYTVKVVPTIADGYKLKSVTAYKTANPSFKIAVSSDNTFTMPGYDVTVKIVAESISYKLIADKNIVNGTLFFAKDDGTEITTAKKSDKVVLVATPNITGMGVSNDVAKTYYTVTDSLGKVGAKQALTFTKQTSGVFAGKYTATISSMPAGDVTGFVTFVKGSSHSITLDVSDVTSSETKISLSTTSADAAAQVTVIAEVLDTKYNYTVCYKYLDDDGVTWVTVPIDFNKVFAMPNYDITVVVTQYANSHIAYVGSVKNGSIKLSDTYNEVVDGSLSAAFGDVITITASPSKYYSRNGNEPKFYTDEDNNINPAVLSLTQIDENTWTFTMPAYNIRVNMEFTRTWYPIQTNSGTPTLQDIYPASGVQFRLKDEDPWVDASALKAPNDTTIYVKVDIPSGKYVYSAYWFDTDKEPHDLTVVDADKGIYSYRFYADHDYVTKIEFWFHEIT